MTPTIRGPLKWRKAGGLLCGPCPSVAQSLPVNVAVTVALADIIPSLIQLLIRFHDTLVTIACLSLLPFIEYRKQGDSSHYLRTRMPLWALERCRCELS